VPQAVQIKAGIGYLAPVALYSIKNLMRTLDHGTLICPAGAASTLA
jgi:hypothetical protein